VSTRDFFRRHVMHNIGLKIISLLLAIGFGLPSRTANYAERPDRAFALRWQSRLVSSNHFQ